MSNILAVIFTFIWVVSWFTAIWIYHWEFFLTGLFSLVLAILYVGKEKEQQ